MKVLHITPYYKPAWHYGGPPRSISTLCEGLMKIGVRTDVVTTNSNKIERLNVKCDKPQLVDGVKVFYNNAQIISRLWSFDFIKMYTELIPYYDLIHIFGLWHPTIIKACRICENIDKPFIFSPRGTLSTWSFNYRKWRKKVYWKGFAKRNILSSTAIHFTSENEYRDAVEFTKEHPFFIVPNAIDFDNLTIDKSLGEYFRKNLGIPKNCFVILSLGRVHPTKANEFLIEAMQYLDATYKLLIVGNAYNNNYLEKLKKMAHDFGVSDQVFFHPHVDGKAKDAVFSAASMFALMSYTENFGLTVIEAMYYRLPVLLNSKISISSEIERAKCGFVVNQDSREIACFIKKIRSDPSGVIVNKAQEFVLDKYNKLKIAEDMKQYYESILNISKNKH